MPGMLAEGLAGLEAYYSGVRRRHDRGAAEDGPAVRAAGDRGHGLPRHTAGRIGPRRGVCANEGRAAAEGTVERQLSAQGAAPFDSVPPKLPAGLRSGCFLAGRRIAEHPERSRSVFLSGGVEGCGAGPLADTWGAVLELEKQAHYLLRDVGKAMRDFAMVAGGDRVAVAVSGGKDSLGLLELLDRHRSIAQVRYEVAAIHVRGDATGRDRRRMRRWRRGSPRAECPIGWSSRIERRGCATVSGGAILDCQRCTWLRRKALFTAADDAGVQCAGLCAPCRRCGANDAAERLVRRQRPVPWRRLPSYFGGGSA